MLLDKKITVLYACLKLICIYNFSFSNNTNKIKILQFHSCKYENIYMVR